MSIMNMFLPLMLAVIFGVDVSVDDVAKTLTCNTDSSSDCEKLLGGESSTCITFDPDRQTRTKRQFLPHLAHIFHLRGAYLCQGPYGTTVVVVANATFILVASRS